MRAEEFLKEYRQGVMEMEDTPPAVLRALDQAAQKNGYKNWADVKANPRSPQAVITVAKLANTIMRTTGPHHEKLFYKNKTDVDENFADGNSMSTKDMAEGQHQHTEIIKWPVGNWIVYLDNHSVIRAMTRNIGPRMMSNLLNMVSTIPNLEDKVPKNGAFWIQDIKTNSSFYFRRLDIPGEPLAVRCETGVQDVPRANKNTPVFRVNAYTGPETPKDIQGMKQAKLRSKFVGTNVMASNLATNIQKGHLGNDDVIRNPATQDSKRYDRAFKQAQQMDKEVDENFADGRVKGKSRPGRVKRSGASCNGSVTDLRRKAKNASGEKARMYHWCANMKSGRKK